MTFSVKNCKDQNEENREIFTFEGLLDFKGYCFNVQKAAEILFEWKKLKKYPD